jgi:hypothetical protein
MDLLPALLNLNGKRKFMSNNFQVMRFQSEKEWSASYTKSRISQSKLPKLGNTKINTFFPLLDFRL